MKYTIFGFQQDKLVELGVDIIDAAILRELMDFKATGKMVEREVNGKNMFWVKYSNLIEQLPIMGIKSKDSIYRRLRKLVDAGLLDHETFKSAGTYSFFSFTPLSDGLIYQSDEKPMGTDEKLQGYGFSSEGGTDEKSEQKTLLSKNTILPNNKDVASLQSGKEPVESRDKKPKPEEKVATVPLDPSLTDVFDEWLAYKREKRQGYKTIGLNALIKKLNKYPVEVVRKAVADSISNNWSGLFPERVSGAEPVDDREEVYRLLMKNKETVCD